MNRITSLSSAIVVLAATALGTAGCASKNESPFDIEKQAFDDVRAEIQSIVSDPDRAAEAIDLVSALQQSIDDTQKDVSARKARIRELNADYDASRADIEAQFDQIKSDIKSNHQRASEIHRQLVSVLTADEWAEVEKASSQAMAAAIKSLQSI